MHHHQNLSKAGAFCAAVCAFCLNVFAFSGGTITGTSNNWGTGGNVPSPVTLTSDVTVPQNITLIIQPGTVVTGNFAIIVNGSLQVNGTVDAFAAINGGRILFSAGGGASKLQFLKINTAASDAVNITGANVELSHVEIQNFGTNGVYISGASSAVKINFCTIGAQSRWTGNTNDAFSVTVENNALGANISILNSILGLENRSTTHGLKLTGGNSTTLKISHTFVSGTRTGTSSQETNVYTANPGIFDIPNSRFILDKYAPAIDAADPAESYSNEPAPSGNRAAGYLRSATMGSASTRSSRTVSS